MDLADLLATIPPRSVAKRAPAVPLATLGNSFPPRPHKQFPGRALPEALARGEGGV